MTDIAKAVAEFELTPEDWEEVNAVHLFDSPLHHQLVGRTRVVSALLFLTLAALSLLLGFAVGAIMFGATALAAPALIGPLHQHAQRRALRKLGEQGISNGTFGHHRVEVRDAGLFHVTDAYESLIRWHAIEDVKQKADNFFVYTGPNAFLPIPVTAFPDSESLRHFADAFYERLEEHRKLGRKEQHAAALPPNPHRAPFRRE